MVVPWTVEQERSVLTFRIGSLVHLRAKSPRTGASHDFYELRFPDWINVVPVTRDGRVLLIRQFRAGTRQITVELPGGKLEVEVMPDWRVFMTGPAEEIYHGDLSLEFVRHLE